MNKTIEGFFFIVGIIGFIFILISLIINGKTIDLRFEIFLLCGFFGMVFITGSNIFIKDSRVHDKDEELIDKIIRESDKKLDDLDAETNRMKKDLFTAI